jgi:hypothetical protein
MFDSNIVQNVFFYQTGGSTGIGNWIRDLDL